jgi:hypothetical protein
MPELRRQQRSCERNHANPKHQSQVQQQQSVVCLSDMRKQSMVVDPHDADEGEADEERQERWPLAREFGGQSRGVSAGDFDLEDQQRNGDGEHAIRERLQARSFGSQGKSPTRNR